MNDMPNQAAPTISMRDFFELSEVVRLIEIQKRNPFNSPEHRMASVEIIRIADRYNCAAYFE